MPPTLQAHEVEPPQLTPPCAQVTQSCWLLYQESCTRRESETTGPGGRLREREREERELHHNPGEKERERLASLAIAGHYRQWRGCWKRLQQCRSAWHFRPRVSFAAPIQLLLRFDPNSSCASSRAKDSARSASYSVVCRALPSSSCVL